MLTYNIEREQRRERPLWTPYYERITMSKKAYTRKIKHKAKYMDSLYD